MFGDARIHGLIVWSREFVRKVKGVDSRSTASNCACRSFEPHRFLFVVMSEGGGGTGGANDAHAFPVLHASEICISSDVS